MHNGSAGRKKAAVGVVWVVCCLAVGSATVAEHRPSASAARGSDSAVRFEGAGLVRTGDRVDGRFETITLTDAASSGIVHRSGFSRGSSWDVWIAGADALIVSGPGDEHPTSRFEQRGGTATVEARHLDRRCGYCFDYADKTIDWAIMWCGAPCLGCTCTGCFHWSC